MGGVDVLINNAAYAYRAEIGALDVGDMKKMFDTNIFGLVDLTNRLVPQMKSRGFGDIVNIASTSGMKGAAGATPYAASKWALRGISQCWQAELRPHGVRVVCVCPSEVQTNFGGRGGRNNPNKLYAERYRRDDHGGAQHAATGALAGACGVREQSVEGRLARPSFYSLTGGCQTASGGIGRGESSPSTFRGSVTAGTLQCPSS